MTATPEREATLEERKKAITRALHGKLNNLDLARFVLMVQKGEPSPSDSRQLLQVAYLAFQEGIEFLAASDEFVIRSKLEKEIEKRKAELTKVIQDCKDFLLDDYDQQTQADQFCYEFALKELDKILLQIKKEEK